MKKWTITFWIVAVNALGWCGFTFVSLAVSSAYHPMAAKGDLLHTVRLSATVIVLLTAITMAVLHFNRGPLKPRSYQIGLFVTVLACILPILPRIDSGHMATYYLDDQRHDIPWQFDPSGNGKDPGGSFIRVRVSADMIVQDYLSLSQSVSISKSADFNFGRGGPPPDEICTSGEYRFNCEWREGAFVYAIDGDTAQFPEDITSFQTQVVDLLTSFETPAS